VLVTVGKGLLSQLWGLVAGASRFRPAASWRAWQGKEHQLGAIGTLQFAIGGRYDFYRHNCNANTGGNNNGDEHGAPITVSGVSAFRLLGRSWAISSSSCVVYNTGSGPDGLSGAFVAVLEVFKNGSWQYAGRSGSGQMGDPFPYILQGTASYWPDLVNFNGQPLAPPLVPDQPAEVPDWIEEVVVEPAPPPALLPPPLPLPPPLVGDPLPEFDTGTAPAPLPPLLPLPLPPLVLEPVPPQLPAPITTPIDSVIPWPGAPPVGSPGQSPRPDLVGIAQELGKIERKLEIAFSPPADKPGFNWADAWGAFNALREFLIAVSDQGSYEISSPCVSDGQPGSAADPLVRSWSGSFGPTGQIITRLDAIAGLLQDHKTLKQPTCEGGNPPATGTPIMVRFLSTTGSPASGDRLRKDFGYRDQSGSPLEVHAAHWANFTWQSGPWIVFSRGLPWGKPQVWAASQEEGERVLRHAALVAGVDLDAPGHRFDARRTESLRHRHVLTMRTRTDAGGRVWVSTRDDADGPSEVPAHLPATLRSRIDS
jgi:hypothetical protein